MDEHTEVIEAAEAVREALEQLSIALNNDRDVWSALREGGSRTELGQAPYELRNLIPDLEGQDGGWLMGKGESFAEAISTLVEWVKQERFESPEELREHLMDDHGYSDDDLAAIDDDELLDVHQDRHQEERSNR